MRKTFLAAVSALALAPLGAQAQQVPSVSDNILINPWMEIDQLKEGATNAATVAASGTYTIVKSGDGWSVINSNNSTGSPTTTFQNAATYNNGATMDVKYTSGTAGTAGASDLLVLFQAIEPIRLAPLQYGTSNAQGSYLSFCGQASLAGTYSFFLMPNLLSGISATSNTQTSYYQQFTLPAATKQCYQFFIPPALTGTFGTSTTTVDSTHGLNLGFTLGVGTNLGGATLCAPLNGVWMTSAASKQCLGVSTQVAMNNNTAATFEVTGVKWSLNPSPLAHQPVAELLEAQRYFAKSFPVGYGGNGGGIAPAQTAGTNSVVGACAAAAPVVAAINTLNCRLPTIMRTAVTAASVTTFDAQAADSKCFDITGGATQVTATLTDFTKPFDNASSFMVICSASGVATAGNLEGVHYQVDLRE